MKKMINELRYLKSQKNAKNCKKFVKLFNKAAQTYADFYGKDLAEGMMWVSAQIDRQHSARELGNGWYEVV